jgi:hypothetical protein
MFEPGNILRYQKIFEIMLTAAPNLEGKNLGFKDCFGISWDFLELFPGFLP